MSAARVRPPSWSSPPMGQCCGVSFVWQMLVYAKVAQKSKNECPHFLEPRRRRYTDNGKGLTTEATRSDTRSRGTPEPTGDVDSVPAWMAAGLAMPRGAAASKLGSGLYGRLRTICTSLAPTASTSSIRLGFGRTFRAAGRPAPRLREKQHEERSSSIDPAPPWRAAVPSPPADIRPVGQCR
jgi:hypothetical protein